MLLLCPLAFGSLAVGARLFYVGFPLQGVQAVVECGELAFVISPLHLGAARHEIVAHGGKGEDEVLRGDVLAVHQPVHLTFQPDGEAAAHVGLDVERGRNVEFVELLVAVRGAHIARDGYFQVVADGRTIADRCGMPALRLRVADVDAVLVALGKGVAHARAYPDVQPLRTAARPQLHEVEAYAELGVVVVHQVVAVRLDGRRLGVERGEALFTAVARPKILGAHAHPGADGEVHAATHGGRLFVTAFGIEVLIPHIGSPRQSALGIDAPSAGAQLAVLVSRRLCSAPVRGLRLCADGYGSGEQDAETHSCPSAAERRDERFRSRFVHN